MKSVQISSVTIAGGTTIHMATCLGHRYGTGCSYRSRNTQKRANWEKWQLCYKCARILHPEHYENEKNHGVHLISGVPQQHTKTPFAVAGIPKAS